ncbi:MAG: amidohydrolase family protein, partial [Thermoplasmatota archaeon]
SVYTCSDARLAEVAALADELGRGSRTGNRLPVRVHAHCSETRTEVQGSQASRGLRPLGVLARAGLLGRGAVLAHCGWITKAEVAEIARAGASVAHCPVSNMKLATGGTMPLPEMLAAGVAVGLGTDGAASNNSLDLVETMKFSALVHKQHRWDATVADAETVLSLATAGGARALGLADRVGTLDAGKQADFVVWDVAKPHLAPARDVASTLVYAARASDVAATVVAGRVLYARGAWRTIDTAKAMSDTTRESARILAK